MDVLTAARCPTETEGFQHEGSLSLLAAQAGTKPLPGGPELVPGHRARCVSETLSTGPRNGQAAWQRKPLTTAPFVKQGERIQGPGRRCSKTPKKTSSPALPR